MAVGGHVAEGSEQARRSVAVAMAAIDLCAQNLSLAIDNTGVGLGSAPQSRFTYWRRSLSRDVIRQPRPGLVACANVR